MKKLCIPAACLLAALSATPAAAQSISGQVAVTGFVASRCATDDTGTATFSRTIDLGELTATAGTLLPSFSNSTSASPAKTTTATVGCSGAASTIRISATRLSNSATAESSLFSNDIDYTAEIRAALSSGGFATASYTTAATLPAATSLAVSSNYAGVANNVQISVYGLAPENGSSSFLVAGNYTSTISVTITPSS